LVVIPTITPTPLPTPIPYEQLIPNGWTQHRTALVEIWLPPAYKNAKKVIPEGAALSAVPELVFSQPATKADLYGEFVLVVYEPLTIESLDSFLDVKLQSVPSTVRVVDRRKTLVNTTEAIRVMTETSVDGIDVNGLTYIILDGGTVWYVEFIAQINDFYEDLELFEDAMLTFRLVR